MTAKKRSTQRSFVGVTDAAYVREFLKRFGWRDKFEGLGGTFLEIWEIGLSVRREGSSLLFSLSFRPSTFFFLGFFSVGRTGVSSSRSVRWGGGRAGHLKDTLYVSAISSSNSRDAYLTDRRREPSGTCVREHTSCITNRILST